MADRVEVAERRIRDIVNDARRKVRLMRNRQRWFQLCSAMDAIGDTQMAVRAYLDDSNKANDDDSHGWAYIVVYGVLQVLYVQQDAAKMLARCVGIESFELPDEVVAVREARNDSIGHPTGKGNFISRITLSTSGFQLLVHRGGARTEFRWIGVREAAEKQTESMGALLEQVVEHLVADELAHRRGFRDKPLRDLLPSNQLGYAQEKIAEGLRDAASKPFALGGIDVIRDVVTKFTEAIEERGLAEAYKDSVGETLAEVEFALGRIEARLGGELAIWTERDAEVYWWFLATKLDDLEELAESIDKDYASDEVGR